LYIRKLVELADKYAFALAYPAEPIMKLQDLQTTNMPPAALDEPQKRRLRKVAGRWPDFSLEVAEVAKERKVKLSRALGPSKPADFPPAVRQFIDNQLKSALDVKEREQLKVEEGHWPEYPRLLIKFAHEHKLTVPGMSLPNRQILLDRARQAGPE